MSAASSLDQRPGLWVRVRRWIAPFDEVSRWVGIACIVALVLLGGTAVISLQDAGHAADVAGSPLLLHRHDLGDALFVFRRNLLVLGIHLCACWIGAIVGRPHRPSPENWGRWGALNRAVPGWMARASLYYALLITVTSVAVQAIALARELADLSSATDLSRVHLLWLVLPHAAPELIAVFLPLGLFLLEARRGRLDRLGPWSLQAAVVALPVLMCAAAIETWVTPGRIIAASHHAEAARAALVSTPPPRR